MKRTIAVAGIGTLLAASLLVGTGAGAGAGRAEGSIARVKDAAGSDVGVVRFVPQKDGKVKITARLRGLTAGFHGFHVHSVGVCNPEATDPSDNVVPFLSAGGHYNPVAENTHGAHAGDMPPVLAANDGTALLRFKTDRFKNRALLDADGSAVILHAGPDNLSHVPGTATSGERYHSHVDDVFGPDAATRATGDAGARFGCGVIKKAA